MLGEKQEKVRSSLSSLNGETEDAPKNNLFSSSASQTTANCKFIKFLNVKGNAY